MTLTLPKVNLGFDIFWTTSVFFTSIILLLILVFQYTAGAITNQVFFVVYVALGCVSVLMAGLAVTYHIINHVKKRNTPSADQEVASALFLSDTSKQRFLSNIILKLIVFVGLTFLVLAIVLVSGAIVNAPNPYSSAPLDTATLKQHSFTQNTVNIGVYPGFYEETPIFFLDSIIVMVITFGGAWLINTIFRLRNNSRILPSNIGLFLIGVFIAVSTGAFVFMIAHNTAYGLDAKAKISAYVFDWILQLMNQLTGTFGSWLPHAANNMAVAFRTQGGYSIGGNPA
jgi:hypothetical protein